MERDGEHGEPQEDDGGDGARSSHGDDDRACFWRTRGFMDGAEAELAT